MFSIGSYPVNIDTYPVGHIFTVRHCFVLFFLTGLYPVFRRVRLEHLYLILMYFFLMTDPDLVLLGSDKVFSLWSYSANNCTYPVGSYFYRPTLLCFFS